MGLDMYLEGRKFLFGSGPDLKRPEEDGFPIKYKVLELGYWRKEPDLHGYIVEKFAEGKDECQDIYLSVENMEDIRAAVRERRLPHTEGFFFGAQCDPNSENPQEREWALQFEKETDETFAKAIEWLKNDDHEKDVWRTVYYRASW